jgi:hypothetical protein
VQPSKGEFDDVTTLGFGSVFVAAGRTNPCFPYRFGSFLMLISLRLMSASDA